MPYPAISMSRTFHLFVLVLNVDNQKHSCGVCVSLLSVPTNFKFANVGKHVFAGAQTSFSVNLALAFHPGNVANLRDSRFDYGHEADPNRRRTIESELRTDLKLLVRLVRV